MITRNSVGTGRRGRMPPLVDLRQQLVAETSRSLLGVAWRWRNEITGVFLAVCLLGHLEQHIGGTATWATFATVAVLVFVVGPLRRFVVGRFWCGLTRHRLFAVFNESRVFNRSGRFPLILRVARTPVGERALVWCRPGICAEDLEARVEDIRAACWSRDVRVTRSDRWSQLVAVEIVRRDPLAASESVRSTLTRHRGSEGEVIEDVWAA
jgi:hypothetical protein